MLVVLGAAFLHNLWYGWRMALGGGTGVLVAALVTNNRKLLEHRRGTPR